MIAVEDTRSQGPTGQVLDDLRILAEERRLRILSILMQSEQCVCDLEAKLGMRQSLVSHHLTILRNAGFVQARREAQWMYYSIVPERVAVMVESFRALFDTQHLPLSAAYGARMRCETDISSTDFTNRSFAFDHVTVVEKQEHRVIPQRTYGLLASRRTH